MAEFSITTIQHPNGWIIVPLVVSNVVTVEFVLNTFRPIPSISEDIALALAGFSALPPSSERARRYLLPRVTAKANPCLILRSLRAAPLGRSVLRECLASISWPSSKRFASIGRVGYSR